MANTVKPSTLPDEKTLAATEERLKRLVAPPSGGGLESLPAPEPAKTAKEQARERLLANPRDAVARRLRRKGIATGPLESGGLESLAPAEATFPESAELNDADIARGLERIIGRNELLGVQ